VCAGYPNHPVDTPAVCESSTVADTSPAVADTSPAVADTSPAVADACESESPFCVQEYAEKVAGEVLKDSLTTLPEYPPRRPVLAPLEEEGKKSSHLNWLMRNQYYLELQFVSHF